MKHLLLIVLYLLSCGFSSTKQNYHTAVMSEIRKYSNKLEKEQNIELALYGLDAAGPDKVYDAKVHTIVLGYRVDKNMKFDEAKKYFYAVVDGLLDHLNKNEAIQPYFAHYPVTYEDLEFFLAFDYKDKGFLKKDDIDSIHIYMNKIRYYVVQEDGQTDKLHVDWNKPGVSMIEHEQKTRIITKNLPEKD